MEKTMFETPRLIIRPYKHNDAKAVHSVMNNYNIFKTTYGIPYPCDIPYVKKWVKFVIENLSNRKSFEYAVIEKSSGKYIGNVGLINVDTNSKRCDISYFIDYNMCNNGYATEASMKIVEFAFLGLNMYRVGGMCMAVNGSSARVMEKLGMKHEGTFRKYFYKENSWVDAKNYSILKEEFEELCKIK